MEKKISLLIVLVFFIVSEVFAQMQVIGHWDFGETFEVAVKDNYLYLAAGEQVRIYDISTKDKLLNLCWKQTDHAVIGRDDTGIYKEGTPPINILHTGGYIGGYFTSGMCIEENYLYVGNDRYFVIADITNPQSAYIVSSISIPYVSGIAAKGNYAYVSTSAGTLNVIDLTNKAAPRIVKTSSGYALPRGIYIYGNYLYLGDTGKLGIYDMATDPSNPVLAGTYSGGTEIHSDVVVKTHSDGKTYAYIVRYKGAVDVVDVTNPTNPTKIVSVGAGALYNKIAILGDYAYVSERYQGFDIINISNPLTPSIVSEANVLPGYEEGIVAASFAYGTYAFLATNTAGLGIVNVDNAISPVQVGTIITPGGADSVDVKGNYVYLGGHNVGVWVLDISDPANPTSIAIINNVGRNTGVKIQGNYLYIAGGWSNLSVADISNPLNPKLLIAGYGPALTGPFVADGNYLYNGGAGTNNDNLIIYDISNPSNPTTISTTAPGWGTFGSASAKYGTNYVVGGGLNGLFIVDISDKTSPKVVGKYTINLRSGTYSGDVKVVGDIAYGAAGSDLVAFDISNVTNPVLIGRITVTDAAGIVILGSTAYVFPTEYVGGFEAVDISDPRNMKIIETLDIGGNRYESDIVEQNGLLYTNNGHIVSPLAVKLGNVSGAVIDEKGAPLSGAAVSNGTKTAITDATGKYSLADLMVGAQTITASQPGYYSSAKTTTVMENSTVTADFQLSPVIPPSLISFSPAALDLTQDESSTNVFSITVDQPVTNKWLLDNVQQSETSANYAKTWAYNTAGSHSLTYTGTNAGGTVSQTWNITVNNVPDTTPPVISDLGSSAVTGSTVVITWTTDEPATSQIEYGSDTAYGSTTAADSNLVTNHSVTITGLSANSTYHYRIRSKNNDGYERVSADYTFKTLNIDPSLLAWWKFEEGSGTNVANIVTGSTGTLVLGVDGNKDPAKAWVNGKFGQALQFDGVDDYVDAENAAFMGDLAEGTISVWIKVNVLSGTVYGATGMNQVIIGKASGPDNGLGLKSDNSGHIRLRIAGNNLDSVTSIKVGEWSSVNAVWSSSGMKIYINGTLDNSATTGGNLYASGFNTLIARMYSASSAGSFNGIIDELKIYNKVLSDSEIQAEYNAPDQDLTPPQISAIQTTPNRTSAIITWTTDEPANSLVKYGTQSGNYPNEAAEVGLKNNHSLSLTDLAPNTVYYLIVRATDAGGNTAQSNEYSFTTLEQEAAENLGLKIKVFPNPYIKGKSPTEKITFANLPKEATLKIYNSGGELVKELSELGGKAEWSISDVKSGVYLYVVNSAEGVKKGKVSVIK